MYEFKKADKLINIKINTKNFKQLKKTPKDKNLKGARVMAVSKATLTCISGEVGARLVKDIATTTINTSLITECRLIMEKLAKRKGK